EKFILQGSASESSVSTITTIDHNPASGIARAAKEIMADFVIIGWPQKAGFLDKIFGEKTDSIINNVDKGLVLCRFVRPLIEKKKLVFVCPPFTEKETGFATIVQKVFRISQEYSIPVVLYSEGKTYEAVQQIMKALKLNGKVTFNPF